MFPNTILESEEIELGKGKLHVSKKDHLQMNTFKKAPQPDTSDLPRRTYEHIRC